jgi:2'-5' RNA ligase
VRQPPGVIRAFVALDLPAEARQALAAAIQQLRAAVPRGVRWVDPAGIHLTLKFLAALDAQQTADVLAALGRAAGRTAPFELRLDALGTFPNSRQPRVLWAGVAGDLTRLHWLREAVERQVSSLGLPQEPQAFFPHLTLGRVREDAPPPVRAQIATALATVALGPASPWRVTAVHLVRSTLTPDGPRYTLLGSVSPLGEGGPPQP